MAEPKSEQKSALSMHLQDFFSSIFSELSKSAERMIKRLGEFLIFKKLLKRYAAFWAMMLAAIITILYGLGTFISSFFPGIRQGLMHIFIGLAVMAASLAYRKSKSWGD